MVESPTFALRRPEDDEAHIMVEISSRKEAQEGGYDFDLLGFAGDGSMVLRRCSDGRIMLSRNGRTTLLGKLEADTFRAVLAANRNRVFDLRRMMRRDA